MSGMSGRKRAFLNRSDHVWRYSVDSRFVGLNATAQMIEVAVRPTGEMWRTDFADETITATATKLKHMGHKLVFMEGTGTLELPVAGFFATVGQPLAIANPHNI